MINFSCSWIFLSLVILFSHGGFLKLEASHNIYRHLQSASESSSVDQKQPYRTAFHFQPSKNWMNDPNGPFIYKGIYHLFYQYNPFGSVWGNIVWAHSTSTDLVNWTPHPHAIYPSIPSDINGCWSGSTTILPNGKLVILYTGINKENHQVQNMAVPKNLSDPYLLEWVKPTYNPLMEPTPYNEINGSSFRDPTTAWMGPDGRWRLIVGNKKRQRGIAILYRSKDFVRWTKAQHPLHSVKDNGMWECPDFFPVSSEKTEIGLDTSTIGNGVKHVLKVSLDNTRYEYYTVGTYDIKKDKYIPDVGSVESDFGLRYDYGKFYASKTFFDSIKHRRILWGWINESTNATLDIAKGWSGIQAIPREMWLDKLGKQLIQWPIREIEKLRTKQVSIPRMDLKGGSLVEISGVTASQADIEVTFELPKLEHNNVETIEKSLLMNPKMVCGQKVTSVKGMFGPFGLLVLASKNLQEYTAVFFRIFRVDYKYVVLMCSDQTRSSAYLDYDKPSYGVFLDVDPTKEKLSLRSLIDRSIVESFGGEGKACITSRVYPSLAIDGGAHLYAFNNGTQSVIISSLTAWSMKNAHIN
ncbi:beta-fructofuranosidase, insoluble isoenzyme CWINV1-like [Impatiens glandulifera]|uniref:beta-fructofuranosidase, insoluble isoenzyme CWINV1-like n=1 Tax=Impatiens glandulifera TaxID=253017 RepID=UPI001FB08851|nr:beta-fructofuranosidase, insoluble isoenzyme CWINV1-like [Impatiens glandulifera]